MELTGKIISCLEKKSGTGRTGNPWSVQSFVLEFTQGNYPRHMVFDVFGEDNLAHYNLQNGDTVTVSFYIDAREYNGRYYNSVRATGVMRPESLSAAAPMPQPVPYEPVAPAVSSAPAPMPLPEPEESSDNMDDLPF